MNRQGKREKRRFMLLILLLCLALTGCGDDEGKYSFGGEEPKEIDPWVYIQDTSISDSVPIRNFASSAARLGIVLGIIGIVFSVFYMAIRILFSGSVKTKSEVKEEAVMKGLIAIMISSVPFWLGVCKLLSDVLV